VRPEVGLCAFHGRTPRRTCPPTSFPVCRCIIHARYPSPGEAGTKLRDCAESRGKTDSLMHRPVGTRSDGGRFALCVCTRPCARSGIPEKARKWPRQTDFRLPPSKLFSWLAPTYRG
jgi:hypothetical protein